MIQIINESTLDDLDSLIERYLRHKEEPEVTIETIKKQMRSGISKQRTEVVVDYDISKVARGFLVYSLAAHRYPIIFANWNYASEKDLLDYAFSHHSQRAEYLTFESGYPTPWISDELSQYATSLGFDKHDRGFMRLEPIDIKIPSELGNAFSLANFDASQIDSVSELVFRCVNNTVDQDLFPYVYGTIDLIKQFKRDLLDGKWGMHKSNYSWILYDNDSPIGGCFITKREKSGGIMHIVIDPAYRERGLGKYLLSHSIRALKDNEPLISRIELAVTLSNPALKMYESLGFKMVNESSTYVWKKSTEEYLI